jgi:copper(I)-binding protein
MSHFQRFGRRTAIAVAALLLPSWLAGGAEPAVRVTHPWARPTASHANTGAVYLSLTSMTGDRLTGCSSPVAKSAALHQTSQTASGVMQMRPVPTLDLPAGQTVTLAPGKYHVMLEGLSKPLVAGTSIPLHLTFAHAAPVDVSVPVRAAAPDMPDMPGMKM